MIWLIGFGGALGAGARFWLGGLLNNRALFPIGTWLVNMTGALLLGWLTSLYLAENISDELWFFAGAGFCGAYTTFSTFGYETIALIQEGKLTAAAIYLTVSVTAGCLAAAIGLLL
ncbi:fluoride efflux transporter CrcB [Pseudobacillus badius]|uniref:fluoride efflux transporter CrcB n=1 Tax=Bacillus badius TaxID=1455 RepID=UPI0007B0AA7D|nr:fluoride efflux transporter CrcB [Bacillus badius]KZN99448.1 chromosome condensation protein CrcB [Bacillus badius]MED0668431.1 fluoride efflux transporter CrcB [Bacillus badius]OCS85285.1 chromosome condensation protein CrcB [Bacillus badius]OVE50336.1 chromosome condensation protein CrcB [Bacillus badius]TDW01229.1 CrcB protein [Bacillus badius]